MTGARPSLLPTRRLVQVRILSGWLRFLHRPGDVFATNLRRLRDAKGLS
jgi:hypothetical protein